MKLALCIFKYFPFGGIQRDCLRIADAMAQRGHQIRCYALSWEGEVPKWIDFVEVPVKSLTRHGLYNRFQRWVQRHLAEHPADLVFGFNKMEHLDAYFAGDSCFEDKARTQRSWLYRQLPRYRFFAATETAVFRRLGATEVLTISDLQTTLFKHYYRTPGERLHALPPGIDRSRVAPFDASEQGEQARAEFGVDKDALLLLFVGSGFKKKGLDRVLRALAALPPQLFERSQLFVLGADNFEPFERMAKRLGVSDRVRHFAGRDDVPRFFFAADVLLLPAYDENTGTVILEGLVAGIPVLTTANCGYASYVSQSGAGTVVAEPFTQEKLNGALANLLASDARAAMATNGKAVAENQDIFNLVPRAVSLLEKFAFRRRRGTLAFCLFKYFPYGGLQRDFLRIARICADAGFAIRVYTLSWEGAAPTEFDVVIVPGRGLVNHVRYANYQRWLRQHLRRAPVDCVVGFNKIAGLDVYFAADPCYEHKARSLRSSLYRLLPRYRFFFQAERSVFDRKQKTQVLLLTERQRDDFVKYYNTEPERMRVLPPGVAPDRLPTGTTGDHAQTRAELRAEFDVGEDQLLLLSIGSGFATKGLDRTIQALAALPVKLRVRVHLMVIGQDDASSYLRLATRLGVGEHLRFLAGRDDVPRFLLAADLLLHPAYLESGGIVLLEGIVCGLPVIASAVCGYADYLVQANAGVVMAEPFEQHTYNKLLAATLADPEQRQRWRDNGRAFARSTSNQIYDLPQQAASIIISHAENEVSL